MVSGERSGRVRDMIQSKFRVLVVEDDEDMNALEREFLGVHGIDTEAAFTGNEAIEAFERAVFDAVVLDIMLPQKDGFETCRQLRLRVGNHLPIVMITALDGEECRRRGFEAGADAFFTKPFDPDEVVVALRELLSRNFRHGKPSGEAGEPNPYRDPRGSRGGNGSRYLG
jgi:two-component system alkaline phosphatase synthesis response regulator PhoP